MDDRAADGWESLLAIADAAGDDWPARARAAALALSVGAGREDESLGVRLLADIRKEFDELDGDNVGSADLVQRLNGREEAPWGDMFGKALDTRRLARLLKPYDIKPHTVRLSDTKTAKGYTRDDFSDAWSRYLPEDPSQASHPSQKHVQVGSSAANVTLVTDVTANRDAGGGVTYDLND